MGKLAIRPHFDYGNILYLKSISTKNPKNSEAEATFSYTANLTVFPEQHSTVPFLKFSSKLLT